VADDVYDVTDDVYDVTDDDAADDACDDVYDDACDDVYDAENVLGRQKFCQRYLQIVEDVLHILDY